MSDELETLSDAALSEVFAVEVMGWTFETFPQSVCPSVKHWKDSEGKSVGLHFTRFTTSTDAVLPYLQRVGRVNAYFFPVQQIWEIVIGEERSTGSTLARAACIALIRFKRNDV